MALAHAIADGTEAAYRRGDLFEKRRKLMEAWVGYCEVAPTNRMTADNEDWIGTSLKRSGPC
jgi:hypothetical protein